MPNGTGPSQAGQVECVLLNACHSKIQANAIAEHVQYVIGMNEAISDKAAIAFTAGFYQALGSGSSIEKAYEFGRVQIMMQNVPGEQIPALNSRDSPASKRQLSFHEDGSRF